jgi:hypothetical protein
LAGFGYGVSEYTDIDPIFGTLAGFKGLLVELRGDEGVILRGSASRYWTMIAGPLAIS